MKFVGTAALFSNTEKERNTGNFFLNGKFAEGGEGSAADTVYKRGIYAIADGSPSEAFGGEAAYAAVNTLGDYNERVFFKNYLEFFKESNDGIINQGFIHGGKELAADMAILNVSGRKAKIYSIGNAAVLRIRSGKIDRFGSGDKRFVRIKDFVADEFGEMRFKNVEREAAPHFGVSDAVYAIMPFVKKIDVKKGDIFVLISGEAFEKIGDEAIIAAACDEKNAEKQARSIAALADEKGVGAKAAVVVRARSGVSARAVLAKTAAVLSFAAVLAAGVFVVDKHGANIVSAAKNVFYEKIMGQKDEEEEKLRELSEESSEISAEKREAERIKRKEEKKKKLEEEKRKEEEKRIAEEQAAREQQERAEREKEEIEKAAMEKAAQMIKQQQKTTPRKSSASSSSQTPKTEQPKQTEQPKAQTEPPKAQAQPSAPQGNVEENTSGSGSVELPIDFGS